MYSGSPSGYISQSDLSILPLPQNPSTPSVPHLHQSQSFTQGCHPDSSPPSYPTSNQWTQSCPCPYKAHLASCRASLLTSQPPLFLATFPLSVLSSSSSELVFWNANHSTANALPIKAQLPTALYYLSPSPRPPPEWPLHPQPSVQLVSKWAMLFDTSRLLYMPFPLPYGPFLPFPLLFCPHLQISWSTSSF